MTATREWRATRGAHGPEPIAERDIAGINLVFSDAFTERYRKDGMGGVRVPQLSPAIWRYAIADADGGAMLWRGERDEIVAFNVAHRSGSEGWMGPLAVRTEWQAHGMGKTIVRAGMAWLQSAGVHVVGLETMPRTMDNIGFYSSLGFQPERLTITLTLEAAQAAEPARLLGRLHAAGRDDATAACRALTERLAPGVDFTREIELTAALGLGDTLLHWRGDELVGFALFHTAPLVDGRGREELRVLKMVLASEADMDAMARLLCDAAQRLATRRIAIRVQGEYRDAYRALVGLGARVRWTDLRMVLGGVSTAVAPGGMVLSNWEI